MSLNCGISAGLGVDCSDLRKPGGLAKRLWLFNIDDLRVRLNTWQTGYVTDLEFTSYRGLYEIESAKFSHEATWTLQKGEGGNVLFQHQVIIRAFNNDPTDDALIQDLTVADVGAIVETNNGELLIFGGASGLSAADPTSGSTGRQIADNTATQITLVGVDKYLPKRFLRGGSFDTSLAFLNALTI